MASKIVLDEVSFEKMCDVLRDTTVVDEKDLGTVKLSLGFHPDRGRILILNNSMGRDAILRV